MCLLSETPGGECWPLIACCAQLLLAGPTGSTMGDPQVCTGRAPGREAVPHFPSQQRTPENANWRNAGVTEEAVFSRQKLGVRGRPEEYKVHTAPTLHFLGEQVGKQAESGLVLQ